MAQCMTVVGTVGAYLLSKWLGMPLLKRFKWEGKLAPLQQRVDAARASRTLFFYLAALRTMTVFPQWLVNMGAPHVGIPLHYFIPCTLIGLLPYNFVTVRAGSMIAEIDISQVFSVQTMAMLACLAAVFLLPAVCMRRIEGWLIKERPEPQLKAVVM